MKNFLLAIEKYVIALTLIACGYLAYQEYREYQGRLAIEELEAEILWGHTFVDLLPIQVVDTSGIVIFTPPDCPAPQALKADLLVAELQKLNIPVQLTHRIGWKEKRETYSTQEEADAAKRKLTYAKANLRMVMKRPSPLVFINYKAKSDPTLEEVLKEYRRCSVCP